MGNRAKQFRHWLGQWSRSDWIGILAIIAAFYLTKVQIRVAEHLDSSEKTIAKLDILVQKSTIQIDTLSITNKRLGSTIVILDSMLALNEISQKAANANSALIKNEGVSRLIIARNRLHDAFSKFYWNTVKINHGNPMVGPGNYDSATRQEYIITVKDILYKELDNKFLLQNTKLANKWVQTYSAIAFFEDRYKIDIGLMASDVANKKALARDIDNLWEQVNDNIFDLHEILYSTILSKIKTIKNPRAIIYDSLYAKH